LIALDAFAKASSGLSGTKLSQFAVPKCTQNALQSEGVPLRAGKHTSIERGHVNYDSPGSFAGEDSRHIMLVQWDLSSTGIVGLNW
jgi:hypothetical protein